MKRSKEFLRLMLARLEPIFNDRSQLAQIFIKETERPITYNENNFNAPPSLQKYLTVQLINYMFCGTR